MPPDSELAALAADIDEMERMLDDYLAFARGEGGEESVATDLAGLISDTASGVARAKPGGPARLSVTAPQSAPLSVKPAALKRCLTNVIDNAFKHGRQVVVTLRCDARWATIAVEDDGPGIPEARREEAFRPFHRLDEGRNLQKGGSGLGLAIARDIARAHGGDITLDQSAMGGVKAVIRLPV
jgi:two-component system, OmpR family, osmolarity sensor histidine kinase EnvZ